MHRAVRIVPLQRNRARTRDAASGTLASAVPVHRLRPFHDLLAVYTDRDGVTVNDDGFGEPLIVFRRRLIEDVDDVVEAAGTDAIGVRVVHLDFEALRRKAAGCALVPADLLKLGEDVNAAVRAGARHDVDSQLEVAEAVIAEPTVIVKVARLPFGDDRAVRDCERLRRSAHLPAGEILAVEKTCESGFDRRALQREHDDDAREFADEGHGWPFFYVDRPAA